MREKNIKRVFLCCLTALAVNTYARISTGSAVQKATLGNNQK